MGHCEAVSREPRLLWDAARSSCRGGNGSHDRPREPSESGQEPCRTGLGRCASAFALPLLMPFVAHSSFVRLSRCAGKRKLEAIPVTAPLAPSFYNLSFSTPPLPMAALQPLGAAERERAFAACTPAALAQPWVTPASAPALGQVLGTLPGGGRLVGGVPAGSRATAARVRF